MRTIEEYVTYLQALVVRNRSIKERVKCGEKQTEIARSLGISKQRVHQILNEERNVAHAITQSALDREILVPEPCVVCGNEKVEAHHSDYTKPKEVTWLCVKHHQELHRLMRRDMRQLTSDRSHESRGQPC